MHTLDAIYSEILGFMSVRYRLLGHGARLGALKLGRQLKQNKIN
jgi:hypothetical protein